MKLSFMDFVILKNILEFSEANGRPPYQTELVKVYEDGGLVNQWLENHNVKNPNYASPLKSVAVVVRSVAKWRYMGMLDASSKHYTPTERAKKLFEHKNMGPDWRNWPLGVEVDSEGLINWETVKPKRTNKGEL